MNRLPDLPPSNSNGAVDLQATMFKSRVTELAEYALLGPMPVGPSLVGSFSLAHAGRVSEVDPKVIANAVESQRWDILARLSALGIDPAGGTWKIVAYPTKQNERGHTVTTHGVVWAPSLPDAATTGNGTPRLLASE